MYEVKIGEQFREDRKTFKKKKLMCLELLALVIKIFEFSEMCDTPTVISGKSQTEDLCNNPY